MSVFRQPCRHTNGHTVDREGRLVACEHQGRCVSRTEHDGARTVLADRFEGKRLNSPNDVVVKSDGSIWFTDPTYGIDSDYEGDAAPSEIGALHVYRVDPASGAVTLVADDFVSPTASPSRPTRSMLYVADTGGSHVPDGPRHIRAFASRRRRSAARAATSSPPATPASSTASASTPRGNLWTTAGDGVHCFAPDGTLLGKIRVPEVVANVGFGGPKRNRLFICATTSLFALYVNARGCTRPATA